VLDGLGPVEEDLDLVGDGGTPTFPAGTIPARLLEVPTLTGTGNDVATKRHPLKANVVKEDGLVRIPGGIVVGGNILVRDVVVTVLAAPLPVTGVTSLREQEGDSIGDPDGGCEGDRGGDAKEDRKHNSPTSR
jgi:hypothetical protein